MSARVLTGPSFLAAAAVALVLCAPWSRADEPPLLFGSQQIRFADFEQTLGGGAPAEISYQWGISVTLIAPGDYTSSSLSIDGGAPIPVPLDPSFGAFVAYSAVFPAPGRAALDAAVPGGLSNITMDGPNGTRTVEAAYPGDAYPAAAPFIDAADHQALQGFDPAQSFVFHTSAMSLTPGADTHTVQLFVTEKATGIAAFSSGTFLLDGPLSIAMPAHVLQAGVEYQWQLYDGQDVAAASYSGFTHAPRYSFVYRTSGTFTTAVPEPAEWLLLGAGLALVGLRRRRRG